MLDGISLAASVVTLATTIIQVIEVSKTFYHATAELEALETELEELTRVASAVDNATTSLESAAISATRTLSSSKRDLERLKVIIEAKQLRPANNTSRAQRFRWIKAKSKVDKIRAALKEHSVRLNTLLATDNLSSSIRTEKALVSLRHEIVGSSLQSSDIHEKLSEIHETLQAQSSKIDCLMSLDNLIIRDSESRSRLKTVSIQDCFSLGLRNTFDSSPHFDGNIYSSNVRIGASFMVVLAGMTVRVDDLTQSRTNKYQVLFQRTRSKWSRVDIFLEVTHRSEYWRFTDYAQEALGAKVWAAAFQTPKNLFALLQAFLSREEASLGNKATISLRLNHAGDGFELLKYNSTEIENKRRSSSLYSDPINFFTCMGCPQYCETEVYQVDLIREPRCFLSCVNGRLVYESMIPQGRTSQDWLPEESLYNIHILHVMKSSPYFSELIGIVLDNTKTQIKSHLASLENVRGNLLEKLGRPGQCWRHLENWAVQIIHGVSQLHQQGYVVGTLAFERVPILLTTNGSVRFWRFERRLLVGRKIGNYYPPEFMRYRDESGATADVDSPILGPKVEIFQLGWLLWVIAQRGARPSCCSIEDCHTCHQGHSNPSHRLLSPHEITRLPPLPETIPQYYRDAIDACRAENPDDRPTAMQILSTFPLPSIFTALEETGDGRDHKSLEIADLPHLKNFLLKDASNIFCSECKAWSKYMNYHCAICEDGDFDLCQMCFDLGRHCKDKNHVLVQVKWSGGRSESVVYRSSPDSSGHREIFDV